MMSTFHLAAVASVNSDASHHFSKSPRHAILLIAGLGVEGDAHLGTTVQHLSRIARDPTTPNIRQVHLIHNELFHELAHFGFTVRPGDLGENITTRSIDLLNLPTGTLLTLGNDAVVEITGLRNPCVQIDRFQPGLMKACLTRDASGNLIRKSGVMAIVKTSGIVKADDPIRITLPPAPHRPLQPV